MDGLNKVFDVLSIDTLLSVGSKISKSGKAENDRIFFKLGVSYSKNEIPLYIGDECILMHPENIKSDAEKNRQHVEVGLYVNRVESLSPSSKKYRMKKGCGSVVFYPGTNDPESEFFSPAEIRLMVYLNKEKFNALQTQINSNYPPTNISIEIPEHPKLGFKNDENLIFGDYEWKIDCNKIINSDDEILTIATVLFRVSSIKPIIN